MTTPNKTIPTITMPTPTPAQSERLKELDSNERSRENDLTVFERRERRWHNAYLWTAAGAAILAILSFAFQRLETRNTILGKVATGDIAATDAERQSIEKQVLDFAIAEANSIASQATKEAEDAHKESGDARVEAANANVRAENLEIQAAQLRQDNLKTEEKLTAANAEIASVNAKRLELEKSLAPRTFNPGPNGELPNLENIARFAETKFVLHFLPDAESQRASSALVGILQSKRVGWHLIKAVPDSSKDAPFFDGVLVTWVTPSREDTDKLPEPGKMDEYTARVLKRIAVTKWSQETAEELVDFLKINGWEANAMPSWDDDPLPPGSVGITVGFKPSPYFDSELMKQMNKKMEELRREVLEMDRERREQIDRPEQ